MAQTEQQTATTTPRTSFPLTSAPFREHRVIPFPRNLLQLEEVNFPPKLAATLVGQSLPVELLSVKAPYIRCAEPWDVEMLIDSNGKFWSDRFPLQVFTNIQETTWRVPRHWVVDASDWLHKPAPQPDSHYVVTREHVLNESVHLPSIWDLLEINIPRELGTAAAGKPTRVLVHIDPDQPVRVTWRAPTGVQYRIPHIWRRRRVRLPGQDDLMEEGVPPDVAASYAGRVVSVNFHLGSLCCMPEHYRFRDEQGNRWPVRIDGCFLLGYGDAEEHHA